METDTQQENIAVTQNQRPDDTADSEVWKMPLHPAPRAIVRNRSKVSDLDRAGARSAAVGNGWHFDAHTESVTMSDDRQRAASISSGLFAIMIDSWASCAGGTPGSITFRKTRGDSWVGLGRPELGFGTRTFVERTHMIATSDRRVFEQGAWRGTMFPPVPVGSTIRVEWDNDRGSIRFLVDGELCHDWIQMCATKEDRQRFVPVVWLWGELEVLEI